MTAQRIIEWLLDVEHIRIGRDAPLSLQWHLPAARWLLFAGAILAALVIVWSYAREPARGWRRIVPALFRTGLIALVAAMLCGPVLVLQRNRVEPSHISLLVDTSASMGRNEAYLDAGRAQQIAAGAGLSGPAAVPSLTRLELLQRALGRDDAAALRALMSRNQLQLFAFTDSLALEAETNGPRRAVDDEETAGADVRAALAGLMARGSATDIPAAVHDVLRRTGEGPLAAIVLASDGQSTEPSQLQDAIDEARAAQVPIYTIPIGSPDPPRDLAVGPLRAEAAVFVKDLLAIHARVSAAGLHEPASVELRLSDDAGGAAAAGGRNDLTAQTIRLGGEISSVDVELRTRPARTGRIRYRVEVDTLPGEVELDNNADQIDVEVLDDQLRLLYVEGYPRFEYRYLKNALLRESTIRFAALLLSADAGFAQEGTEPVRRFPETPEELNQYNVVLFGDVDPSADWLSPSQMEMLVDFVARRGGGFGLIAGERWAPQRFRGTPLEKLIPVRIDPEFLGHYETALTTPYHPQLTIEGRHSPLFRFDADPDVSEKVFEGLPGWFWTARTLGARPGAEVLLEHPSLQTLAGPMPLVVLGRYGAGRTLFQASDDAWRWRRHTGELLVDTYWVRVARALLAPHSIGQDPRLTITPEQNVYRYGERCVVRVEVRDEETLALLESNPRLSVYDANHVPVEKIALERLGPASRAFEGTFIAPRAGHFLIQADGVAPPPGQRPAAAYIRVETADVERRRPEADESAMRQLAEQTGGAVVPLDRLDEVLGTIRDRSVRIPDDVSEPLWDSKLVFILFVLMIGIEWVVRKALGML